MRLRTLAILSIGAAALLAAAPPRDGLPSIAPDGYAPMLADRAGQVVLVNMWATWCEPCREEFPDLVRVHRNLSGRGVAVVAISLDTASAVASAVIPFLKGQGADFPCYVKAAGDDEVFINAVDRRWSGALPATFVYDRKGRLVKSIYGPTRYDDLAAILTPLLRP